jgi:hypothetical protein
MSTLKDVQQSMGSTPKAATFTGGATGGSSLSALNPTANREYFIFKLVHKKKGRLHVDGVCDFCLNPKTGKRERIWLLNGVDSIWQSELLEQLKDKDFVKRNKRSLTFENGVCRIRAIDERALEFARANTKNVGKARAGSGKWDFYEYDAAEEQKMRYEKQMTRIGMINKAQVMPIDKAKKLASFLGIAFVDDLGQPKGDDGIRTELMIYADTQPEVFAKYIDSQEVDVAYMVKKAIIDAKIDLNGQQGNAIWAGGKGFIAKIPSARKPYEYLTELAMTNSEEGKRFKEELLTFGS